MAIPVGTNDLKIYRRHASYCTRFAGLKNKPDTCRPATKKDQKADTCRSAGEGTRRRPQEDRRAEHGE
jgi:hypothetical protein